MLYENVVERIQRAKCCTKKNSTSKQKAFMTGEIPSISTSPVCANTATRDVEPSKVSEYFEKIKYNENLLSAFLLKFFYADLHIHMQGIPRPQHWREIAAAGGLDYLPAKQRIIKEPVEGSISCGQLLANGFMSREFDATVSVLGHPSHEDYALFNAWKHNIGRILSHLPEGDICLSVIKELYASRTIYSEPILEMETILKDLLLPQNYLHAPLSFDDDQQIKQSEEIARSLLQDYLDEGVSKFSAFFDLFESTAKDFFDRSPSVYTPYAPIQVKFKGGLSRSVAIGSTIDPLANQKILLAHLLLLMELIKKFPDKICGNELVGPEDWPAVEEYLDGQLRLLNYFASSGLGNVSIHVGELQENSGVGMEILRNRISRSVNGLKNVKNLTLSHLNSWIYDAQASELVRTVKLSSLEERKITLITLPISNQLLLKQTLQSHIIHFFISNRLMKYVTVGSDDPGVACAGIAAQYKFLIQADPHYFTYEKLKNLMINAFERSHLKGKGIYDIDSAGDYHLLPLFTDPFNLPPDAVKYLQDSEKAVQEYKHLLSMLEIERAVC